MTTVGSGRATCESGGSGEEFCTSPFRPDINEEPLNVFQEEAGQNVVEEQIDFHNAYKVSTISTGQAPIQDSKLVNNIATTRLQILSKPATMEDLPDELLSNIFIRLFAKQLAQLRSVSRSWNALLCQPSFVKSHLNHSIHFNDQILLVFSNKLCISDSKPFRAHLFKSPHLELTEFNKLVPVNPKDGSTNGIEIIGAVNGLICSSYGDSVINIWNPSLSAVLTLPEYPMSLHRSYKVNLRFGFDPKSNDYKVVKLIRETHVVILEDKIIAIRKVCLQIGVYSMRKGSWELINERFPSHMNDISDGDYICLDGHDGILHWLCYYFRGDTYTQTIVAFDLGSHAFREIPLPDSVAGRNCSNVLGVLGGKLCVMSRSGNLAREVWVMDEYGMVESWVKCHVFSQFTANTYPYGFTSYNKFLINDNGRLVLYDLIAKETKAFEGVCSRNPQNPHKFVEYVDSVVWVAPTEHEMVDGAVQN